MSSLRSAVLIAQICVLGACGDGAKVSDPDTDVMTEVVGLTTRWATDRVEVQFTLAGDPVEEVAIQRQVQGEAAARAVAVLANPSVGQPITFADSTVYSGLEHTYRILVGRERIVTPWSDPLRVIGPRITVSPSHRSGGMALTWTFRPTGVDLFQVIRRRGADEVIVHEGPSDLLGMVDRDLEVNVDYAYQIKSQLQSGGEVMSRVRTGRLFRLASQGMPTVLGAEGEVSVMEIMEGRATVAVAAANGIHVGMQASLFDFGLERVFVDLDFEPVPGSLSAIGVASANRSDLSPRYVVVGIVGSSVVGRIYTSGGTLFREVRWPRVDGEDRTYLRMSTSRDFGRSLLFLSTEKRTWEITPSLQEAVAHELPVNQGGGVVFTGGFLVVADRSPPRLLAAAYTIASKASLDWEEIPLPRGVVPVTVAGTSSSSLANRFWLLGSNGELCNLSLNGETDNCLRLPRGTYEAARFFTPTNRPDDGRTLGEFAVVSGAGRLAIYTP